ncbi:MAG: hypothetical protein J6Y06_08095 [Bacteroidales bacterium]|nr:hypothetical protein [Bacteroidales bacterium]
MRIIKSLSWVLKAALIVLPLITMQSCKRGQDHNAGIVLETETFKLTVGEDAIAKSLVIKKTNEEMLLKGTDVPLFSVTQDRPFNNEIKLQHPNTRTTYKANSLSWDGERLTVGFDTAPYEAVVKVDAGAGYLRFTLEDFICEPEDYGNLALDLPPVAEFRILQLPVKEREHYGEWLNCMWDDASAVCVAGCDPWSLVWHEDRTDGRVLTADLYSGKKLRGGSAAIIAADGKEPFLNVMDGFEVDLNLPRGVQSRRSPILNRSIYWTSNANPSNIDQHIAIARKAGLKMMLFYYTCFVKSRGYRLMGDYDLSDDYPGGYDDLRKMVEKVKAAGITPGFHTLQTHIGVESRYVKPSIDSRLNRKRQFTLKEPIPSSGDISELFVEENPVDSPLHDYTRVLTFGGEGFAYEGYTTEPPYKFTGVSRRAFDTDAVSHRKGEIGGVLDLSEYGKGTSIYLNQDNDLQDEIAEKIARIYNCGFEFLYLDGSEGVHSPTGINVSLAQYRVASKLARMPIFTEGAAKSHFGWHLQAGANAFDVFPPEVFKEKILEFPYAEAPRMADNMTRLDFGWWNIKPETTPEMWNFADSLAAEWHCPVTIQFSFQALESNPHADELLAVLKKWEEYREKEN